MPREHVMAPETGIFACCSIEEIKGVPRNARSHHHGWPNEGQRQDTETGISQRGLHLVSKTRKNGFSESLSLDNCTVLLKSNRCLHIYQPLSFGWQIGAFLAPFSNSNRNWGRGGKHQLDFLKGWIVL